MKLFYRKSGQGPPLIILHGLFGSSDNWITIARRLADRYTVYLPDLRNHGQSPHSDIHTYDSMCDDLYELVTDLGLKKFFLAGHSMGGKTAIAFAARWPGMILGLLVADISPFADETRYDQAHNQHLTIIRTILSTDLASISSRQQAGAILMEKIASVSIRELILKNIRRKEENKFEWKLNPQSLYKNLGNIMAPIDLKEGFIQPVTGFPVIFLKGSESKYLTSADMDRIKKVFPAAELVEIPGAGHWVHTDKPDEVAKYLGRLNDY